MNRETTGPPAGETTEGPHANPLPKAAGSQSLDVFAEARDRYTVADAWRLLRLPGEPKASCRSPFRLEKHPSFSIFADGRAWKDHADGQGGDVIEFVRVALGGDYRDAREWFMERLGIDRPPRGPAAAPVRPVEPAAGRPGTKYPAPLVEGSQTTWAHLASTRRLPLPAVRFAVDVGLLRFCEVAGVACYVVRDPGDRAAEIRRVDGGLFACGSKVFPLRGVAKTWPVGVGFLEGAPADVAAFLCEGASDFLAAVALHLRWLRDGGAARWLPVAVLGASVRKLDPAAAELLAGRRVRLCFDADAPGREAAEHWAELLSGLGCRVAKVRLPEGRDLRDVAADVEPGGLFA